MQPMALVFRRAGGRWKLAAAVNRPASGWPALAAGPPASAPPSSPPADYGAALARVLTHA